MESEKKNIKFESLGKRIRFFRNESGMTQNDLANELNVTRQALSNWERDIYLPDVGLLRRMCAIFGIHMDELMMEVMNMETNVNDNVENKKRFSKYDMAIGLFYAVGLFLGLGVFFVGGFMTMNAMGWAASLFGGVCLFLVFGLLSHAVITLKRKDR